MKNWKTTLFGGLSAVLTALSAYMPEYKEILVSLAAVFAALFAYQTKDKNVTGGTIPQTGEAVARAEK